MKKIIANLLIMLIISLPICFSVSNEAMTDEEKIWKELDNANTASKDVEDYIKKINEKIESVKGNDEVTKKTTLQEIQEELKKFPESIQKNNILIEDYYAGLNVALYKMSRDEKDRTKENKLGFENGKTILSLLPKEKQYELLKQSSPEKYTLYQDVINMFPPDQWRDESFRKLISEKGYKPTGEEAKKIINDIQNGVNNGQTPTDKVENIGKPEENKNPKVQEEVRIEDEKVDKEYQSELSPEQQKELDKIKRESPEKAKQKVDDSKQRIREKIRDVRSQPKPTEVQDRPGKTTGKVEEKSFLQKYWPFLLGIGLYFMLNKEDKKETTTPTQQHTNTEEVIPTCGEKGGILCSRFGNFCPGDYIGARDVEVYKLCCTKPCVPPMSSNKALEDIQAAKATDISQLGFGITGTNANIITPLAGSPPEQDLSKLNNNTDKVIPSLNTLYVLNGNSTNMYTLSGKNKGVQNLFGTFVLDNGGITKISVGEKTGAVVVDKYGAMLWLAQGTTHYNGNNDYYETDTHAYYYESGMIIKPMKTKLNSITGAAIGDFADDTIKLTVQHKKNVDGNGVDASFANKVWTLRSSGNYNAELRGDNSFLPFVSKTNFVYGESSTKPLVSVLQKYDILDEKKSYTIENTKVISGGNVIQNSDASSVKQISENAKKLLGKQ